MNLIKRNSGVNSGSDRCHDGAKRADQLDALTIHPSNLNGILRVPSSKSLTHRAIIAAALCSGTSVLQEVTLSNDVLETLNAIKALGVRWKFFEGTVLVFGGLLDELNNLNKSNHEIEIKCLESASTLRMLAPIVAALELNVKFVVSKRLFERVCSCGEFLLKKGKNYYFKIAKPLKPGCFFLKKCLTSQFVSGLLLILPALEKHSLIVFDKEPESKQFLNLTVSFLNGIGIKIKKIKNGFSIPANQVYRPFSCNLEGDFSLASFFAIAGCFDKITLKGLNSNSSQGDLKIVEILQFCGAKVQFSNSGDLLIQPGLKTLNCFNLNLKNNLDLAPVLAILASFCSGTSTLYGISRLQFKESNRIDSILKLINGLGGKARVGCDCLKIEGVGSFRGGVVNSFNDHRIAMAATVASCASEREIVLLGAKCVSKSWPDFFTGFKSLGGFVDGFGLE